MDFNLSRRYRHFKRYRQITQVLLKNGFGFIVDWLDLGKYLPFKERIGTDEEYDKRGIAKRLRYVLQELGPTYIKFGQLMSTRADVLSPRFIKELRKLQDKAPSVEFEGIKKVLKSELGTDYQRYFKKIFPNPQAAASIAQTHNAVLNNGRNVILKIQRPNIQNKVEVDLEILDNIAHLAEERNLFSRFIKPTQIIEEFKNSIKKEMDFNQEVSNMKRFRNNFNNNSRIVVPEVIDRLSSERLIVMEKIKGKKLSEVSLNVKKERDFKAGFLAELGAKALMKQVLIDGFFHADPHPGNIFIIDKDKIAYIDFGLMGQLTPEMRDYLAVLFFAVLRKNVDVIVDTMIEVGIVSREINMRKFKLDVQELIYHYYGIDLKDIDYIKVLDDFQRIIYKYHIKMPEDFLLLARAIAVSEGVGYMIDPDFNVAEVGNKFLLKLIKDRIKPKNIVGRIAKKVWDFRQSTKGFPGKLSNILDKLSNDEFTIKFKHMNLESLINKLDIISNRLSISLIISALIIGSSMILQTDMHPMFLGIPVLGLLGYIVAGVFGFWLVIDILRSGKY